MKVGAVQERWHPDAEEHLAALASGVRAAVLHGAFSVYQTDSVREAGGWPDMIGEDITLTWALLAEGRTVTFEATAVAFTAVPTQFRRFVRQRSRWARGMIEGLGAYGWPLLKKHNIASHGIAINCLFPWVDLCYTFAFLPGLVLACFGNFAIVGPLTVAVLPLNILLSWLMYRLQRGVYEEMRLKVRENRWGFVGYLLLYQPIMSPIAVSGYAQKLLRRPRRW
ncbi:unannotated protein [freshwater metagenome]|uniref:Unannotated protein n=1 Tax=freshwater metagenome TaxID=449393 RepID=A0A6J7DQI3_9ZZZZ